MEWIKCSERLPERVPNKRYSSVRCLVFYIPYKEVMILTFNHEHMCWDGDDGDDYYCDINKCSHWMPLPETPKGEE